MFFIVRAHLHNPFLYRCVCALWLRCLGCCFFPVSFLHTLIWCKDARMPQVVLSSSSFPSTSVDSLFLWLVLFMLVSCLSTHMFLFFRLLLLLFVFFLFGCAHRECERFLYIPSMNAAPFYQLRWPGLVFLRILIRTKTTGALQRETEWEWEEDRQTDRQTYKPRQAWIANSNWILLYWIP